MALTYTIERDRQLVSVRAGGVTTEREWMQLYVTIRNDPARIDGMDFLFDMRGHAATISDQYLWAVTQRMLPLIPGDARIKWAFVTSREAALKKIDKFSFYLAQSGSITVRAFAEIEPARRWIEEDRVTRHRTDSA